MTSEPITESNRTRGGRRWVLWTFLSVLASICLLFGYHFVRGVWFFVQPRVSTGFDRAEWRSASGSEFLDRTRLRMVEDLLHDHPLVGMDAGAVTKLLGDPDKDPYLLVEQPRHRGAYIYRLGPDHLNLDSMWLVVSWGEDGRVASSKVVSD